MNVLRQLLGPLDQHHIAVGRWLQRDRTGQDKLAAGDLDAEAQKQLAEQLQQIQDKLNEMVDAHREAKQKLQDEIDRCEAAGDMQAAGKLQRQLDQLNALNEAGQVTNLDIDVWRAELEAEAEEASEPPPDDLG